MSWWETHLSCAYHHHLAPHYIQTSNTTHWEQTWKLNVKTNNWLTGANYILFFYFIVIYIFVVIWFGSESNLRIVLGQWQRLNTSPCRRRQEGTSFYLNIQIRNNFNLYQNKYSFHIMESWPWLVFELSKRRTKSFPHGLHLKNIYNDKYVKYNNKCQLRMTHNSIV